MDHGRRAAGHDPHYTRGGSVVPRWPEAPASTMGYHPTRIELHVYLPQEDGETRSTLYEDDGEMFAFRDAGAFYRTEFTLRLVGDASTLDATVTGGGYPAFAREEFVLALHGRLAPVVTLDGREASLRNNHLAFKNEVAGFSLHATRSGDAVCSEPLPPRT